MKATFIHDFPVFIHNEKTYTFGGFPSTIWDRYTKYIDHLDVVCRLRKAPVENLSNFKVCSNNNVTVKPIPNYSSIKGFYKRRLALKEMEKTIKHSDFIILRLPSIVALDAYKFVKKYQKPFIVEVVGNGFDVFYHKGNILGKLMAPIVHKRMLKTVYAADISIYVTEKYLQSIYPNPNQQFVISNVEIQLDEMKEIPNMDIRLKEKSKIIVGFLGAMNVKYKNFYKGLKYLEQYANKHNIYIDLLIAGGGESKNINELSVLCDRVNVNTTGKLESRIKVDEWFKSLDLFVHPSVTEGLPRVVLESMSNDIPVIASTAGGTPEILSKKYLFDPLNYDSFEVAMSNILNENVEEVIRQNRNTIASFDKDVLQKKREKVILSFIKRRL